MPLKLPQAAEFEWTIKLSSTGIGAIAANREYVVLGSRNALDSGDVWTCHRLADGSQTWQVRYPAKGNLDYGNSPRATPLIVGEQVVVLGAFGDLAAIDMANGTVRWKVNFQESFSAELPTWGFCGSPLHVRWMVDNEAREMVIVQPGAKDAGLAAFDWKSGDVVWKSAGNGPSYSSFVIGESGGERQLIGYDESSLGGWDFSGKRLWTLKPEYSGDFNVPTPLVSGQKIFVATENNGARLYRLDGDGRIEEKPLAQCSELAPDTHSPVRLGNWICGVHHGLYCLDASNLTIVHHIDDPAFEDYCSLISDGRQRLLVTTSKGELMLVTVDSQRMEIIDRLKLTDKEEILSHPAIVDDKLIIRIGRQLVCVKLSE